MSTIINATTTNGVVIQPDNSGSLVLQTNSGTTALTIDTSQRAAFVAGTAALPAITTTGDTDTGIWFPAANVVASSTSGTERMRIDTSGNVLVGATSTYGQGNLQVQSSFGVMSLRNTAATAGNYWRIGPDGSGNNLVVYNHNGTGVYIANGGTSWTSSSDETLKENLKPITNAIDKITTLRAVIGNFIADEEKTKHPFLIAQDVQKILPEAVSVSTEGTLGLSYADTIPLLVAAIQEQQTIINDLKARIETLEAK